MNSGYQNGFSPKISFDKVFNESWNLYTKLLGIGALAVLIYVIFSTVISFFIESLTGFGQLSNDFLAEIQGMNDPNALMHEIKEFYLDNFGLMMLTSGLTNLIMLLAFPLAGGFMLVCREMDKTNSVNIGTLFEGFKPTYWGRLMVVGLVYFFISKIAFGLLFIPGIYVWVGAVLACPFVMFTEKSGWESFRSSFQLVNKNWFAVFKILLVASLIGIGGYLLFCIGRILTYPFVLVSIYMVYKNMVGFSNDELSQIGEQ